MGLGKYSSQGIPRQFNPFQNYGTITFSFTLSPFFLLRPSHTYPPSSTASLPPLSPSGSHTPLLQLPSSSSLLFLKVNGAGALVWEAVSVLNGAHLSPSGRLGNLVRKYHQNVTSAANTTTTVEASVKQEVYPLQRVLNCTFCCSRHINDE